MKELRHLNKYFRKYWGQLLVGILITVVARIFSLVMPSYVKNIVEVVEQLRRRGGERQVRDPEIGLAHNVGGPGAVACVVVLGQP